MKLLHGIQRADRFQFMFGYPYLRHWESGYLLSLSALLFFLWHTQSHRMPSRAPAPSGVPPSTVHPFQTSKSPPPHPHPPSVPHLPSLLLDLSFPSSDHHSPEPIPNPSKPRWNSPIYFAGRHIRVSGQKFPPEGPVTCVAEGPKNFYFTKLRYKQQL